MEAPVVVPVPAGVEGAQAQHGLGAIETPFRASDPKAALMLALGEAWRLFARTLTKHTSIISCGRWATISLPQAPARPFLLSRERILQSLWSRCLRSPSRNASSPRSANS